MNKNKSMMYLIGLPNLGVGLLWAMNMTLIPMLVATYNVSNAKAGLLISMGAFTGIFVQYLAGLISDRSNFKMGKRKPFMIMGAIVTTIAMFAMPFAPSYSSLFVIAFIFYFSLNFYQGPYYSMIPEVVDENQLGTANGFARVISVLGGAFIFITGPILWNLKSGLNTNHSLAFFVAGLLGIITVLVTVFFVKERKEVIERKPTKIAFDFIKFPSALKFFAVIFFVYLGHGSLTPFFVKYCVEGLHVSENTASTSLLMLTVVGAIFALPMGMISDKISKKTIMTGGIIIYGIALLAANFTSGTIALYIVMSILGIGFVTIQVTSYAILAEIVPQERLGEFMGIFNFFVSIAQFLANNIMGNLLDAVGYKVYFPIATVYIFTAAIILVFSKLNKHKQNAISEQV